jgi:hypothetical protein
VLDLAEERADLPEVLALVQGLGLEEALAELGLR